jgi:hypothetical protein
VQRPAIDALDEANRELWIRRYDPSSHLARCRVPILFVNGTNDQHYPLRSYSRSFQLVPGPKQIRIQVRMGHSHQAGWQPAAIGLFIDTHVRGKAALPILGAPQFKDGIASVSYRSDVPLKTASLHFTTSVGLLVDRKWNTVSATFDDNTLTTPDVSDDATIWYLSATDRRGAMTSTDVIFTSAD